MTNSTNKHTHVMAVDQVKFAINKLKYGKSDSMDDLLSKAPNDTANKLLQPVTNSFANCVETSRPTQTSLDLR